MVALLVASPVSTGLERWRGDELKVSAAIKDFAQIQEIAFRYLGRPYVRAGSGEPGFDCSGFSCRVFAESGFAIPRTSREQSRAGKSVRRDALMPGDLLFFAGRGRRVDHVGIYLGSGQMIHSASGEGRVIVSNIDDPWYRRRYVGARRVLGVLAPSRSRGAVSEPVIGEWSGDVVFSTRLGFSARADRALGFEAGTLQSGSFELERSSELSQSNPFGVLGVRVPDCFSGRTLRSALTDRETGFGPGSLELRITESAQASF